MSENDRLPPQGSFREVDALGEGGLRAPAGLSRWGKFRWWFRFVILVKLARLRFIAILAVLGALIVYWDTLVAHYEKWMRPVRGEEHADGSDYEYFCSMHPNFVTDNPKEKCPICFMNLSRRKKGEGAQPEALPAGVVTRLQLSPYKVVTANIRTWEVGYEPLVKKIETVGTVEFNEKRLYRVSARVKGRIDRLYANVTGEMVHAGDRLASIYSPDLVTTVRNLLDAQNERDRELVRDRLRLWGIDEKEIKEIERANRPLTHLTIRSPYDGHIRKKYQVEGEYVEESAPLYDVADLGTVWIEAQVYEQDQVFLKQGLPVVTTTEGLPGKEFQGKLAFVYPHLDQASRTLRVRFDIDNPDHEKRPEVSLRPGMYAMVRIDIPAGQLGRQFPSRGDRVLAVPETAVVHTGSQKIVFREESPMTFDAVRVELGPLITRADGDAFYPVLKGLQAGERVVTTGSYLLDAETRVSSAAGSIYYGGTGASSKAGSSATAGVRPSTPEDEDLKVKTNLDKLSTPDRQLAEAQNFCPIQKSRLGSMGPLVKVVLKGQPVFLCCKGCVGEARENPEKTLAEVKRLKKTGVAAPPGAGTEAGRKAARVKANLAQLSDEDRRLAEAQRYCPVEQDNLLGSMGKPVKLVLKRQTVFLCCPSCEDEAKADPDKTLATVEKLKARAKFEQRGKEP
jgi:Cu(I)/Ag(I) efflux system membrane fusion protein